jgi:hypothetical protein
MVDNGERIVTWESGSSDQQRLRAGYAVLSMGVLILMFAWGMAVLRGPQGQGEIAVRHQKLDPPAPDQILPAMGMGMLLCGVCLVVILVLSVVAFVRISRRYREHVLRSPAAPTPTSDVWQMHKVPDDTDDADET